MTSTRRSALAWILIALLGLCACTPVPLGEGQRRQLVRSLTVSVIVPKLEEAAQAADALAAQLASLDALGPTAQLADLAAARTAWRAARVPWKQTEAFSFGPATDQLLTSKIDQAIDFPKVDEEVAGSRPLTVAYVNSIGANRKGFHAVEYLLFGTPGTSDAVVLASLTSEPLADRRRAYMTACAGSLAGAAHQLVAAWDAGGTGGGFAATLTTPGADNTRYPTIKSVVDAFVNESVFLAESIADLRIGKPLGNASGGTPQPQLEESGPSDNSLADAAESLRSIELVYDGVIGDLVAAQSPATDREVRERIAQSIAAVEAVPRPFRVATVDHRAAVQAAYDEIKELKRLLGTEVLATLGATLKFNDNDGD